jgi:molecular chaperone GrpE
MSAKKKHPAEGETTSPEQQNPVTQELEQRLEEAERARDEAKDQVLRSLAEFQNYKKRVLLERAQWRAEALEDVALGLVPLVDNLERGLSAAEQAHDVASVVNGMRLIQKQFESALQQMGVAPIDAVGQPFDPNLHEAVVATETDEHPSDVILEELQRGYTLDGKVIRPSRVRVARNSASAETPADE